MVYNKSDIKINVLSIINNKDDEKKNNIFRIAH